MRYAQLILLSLALWSCASRQVVIDAPVCLVPPPPSPPMFTATDIVGCTVQDDPAGDRVCLTVAAANNLTKYVKALVEYTELVLACEGRPSVDAQATGLKVTPISSGVTDAIGTWYWARWRQIRIDNALQRAGSPTRVQYPLPEAMEKRAPSSVVEAIH